MTDMHLDSTYREVQMIGGLLEKVARGQEEGAGFEKS